MNNKRRPRTICRGAILSIVLVGVFMSTYGSRSSLAQAEEATPSKVQDQGGCSNSQHPSPATTVTSSPTPTAAGRMLYVDPVTGQRLPSSSSSAPQPEIPDTLRNATSKSSEGLEWQPLPGGGQYLDYKGRNQTALQAKVGPDGKPRIGHFGVLEHHADTVKKESQTELEEGSQEEQNAK